MKMAQRQLKSKEELPDIPAGFGKFEPTLSGILVPQKTLEDMIKSRRDGIRDIYLKGDGLEATKRLTAWAAEVVAAVVGKPEYAGIRNKIAVVFVGSSGRAEMCFQSDIDYRIVHDGSLKENKTKTLENDVFSTLQRYGFGRTSSFGVGDIDFFVSGAKFSLFDRLSLDDTSFIAGNRSLYAKFRESVESVFGASPGEIEDTMTNMLFIYNLYTRDPKAEEPNVKKGLGGIRELQFLIQTAKIRHKSKGRGIEECAKDLAKIGRIMQPEADKLVDAANFLFTVRNEMHYQFGRDNDLLDGESVSRLGDFSKALHITDIQEEYKKHKDNVRNSVSAFKGRLRADVDRSRSEKGLAPISLGEGVDFAPPGTQIAIARHDDRVIRLAVVWNSMNPSLLRHVMEKEIENKSRGISYDWNVLFGLAHSKHSPLDVFDWLLDFAESGNPYRKIPLEVIANESFKAMLEGDNCPPILKQKVDRIKRQQ